MAFANNRGKYVQRSTIITGVLIALLCSSVTSADSAAETDINKTWITDVTIISPERLGNIEKGSVLIENGRIARVERNQKAKKPAGATVVVGKGQYLIPG